MPDQLRDVIKSARLKHVPKSQIIIYKGDEPHDVYLIKSGAIKIYDIDEQGNEKILHIVKSPALVPFAFFAGNNQQTSWFYGALTDCELYALPYHQLPQAMQKDSALTFFLMNDFAINMHELLVRLSSLGKTQVRDKLYAALRFLQTHHSSKRRGGWWRVNFAVNQQLLADLSGVTRESTAMAMKDLQDRKIVRCPKVAQLEIHRSRLNELPSS
jgi:CRP/FNR family transcriptional regulator, cyclic AMP receptor protein